MGGGQQCFCVVEENKEKEEKLVRAASRGVLFLGMYLTKNPASLVARF